MVRWNVDIMAINSFRGSIRALSLVMMVSIISLMTPKLLMGQLKVGKNANLISSKKIESKPQTTTSSAVLIGKIKETKFPTKSALLLPSFTPKHYGYFCKLESKIETKSKVPLRFRLGSLDYVNYLEQKFNPSPTQVQYY